MSGTQVLHVASRAEWERALEVGAYRRSTADAGLDEVGFIHCCTGAQLPGVLERHYGGDLLDERLLLVVDVEACEAAGSPVRWEGLSERFPHVYGHIPVGAVSGTRSLGDADRVTASDQAATRSLAALPNLGAVTAAQLVGVGVRSEADIFDIGPVELYLRLRARYPRVSLNFLYALEAIEAGCHWREVTPERKAQLRGEVARASQQRAGGQHGAGHPGSAITPRRG